MYRVLTIFLRIIYENKKEIIQKFKKVNTSNLKAILDEIRDLSDVEN
jgi:hypothetical protein